MADHWTPFPRATEGIEVLEDGTILLSAARAAKLTYDATYDGDGKLTALKVRKIRFTAAIPMSHRLTYGYKLSTDPSALPTGKAIVADAEDIEPGVIRQHYAQAGHTYQRWLRKDSWPVPGSIKKPNGDAQTKADDKLGTAGQPNATLRDDTEYLQHQAERRLGEVGRLQGERPIYISGLDLSLQPGDAIRDIDGVPAKKIIKEVILHCGNETQMTEVVLA